MLCQNKKKKTLRNTKMEANATERWRGVPGNKYDGAFGARYGRGPGTWEYSSRRAGGRWTGGRTRAPPCLDRGLEGDSAAGRVVLLARGAPWARVRRGPVPARTPCLVCAAGRLCPGVVAV